MKKKIIQWSVSMGIALVLALLLLILLPKIMPGVEEEPYPKTTVDDIDEWYRVFTFDNYTVSAVSTVEMEGEQTKTTSTTYATSTLMRVDVQGTETETHWRTRMGKQWYALDTEYSDALAEAKLGVITTPVAVRGLFEDNNPRAAFLKAKYDKDKKAYLYGYTYLVDKNNPDSKVYVLHELYVENGVLVRCVTAEESAYLNMTATTVATYSSIGSTVLENAPTPVLMGRPDVVKNDEHTYVLDEQAGTPAEGVCGVGQAVYHCTHCPRSATYAYVNDPNES